MHRLRTANSLSTLPLLLSLLAGCGGGNGPLYDNTAFSSATGAPVPGIPGGGDRTSTTQATPARSPQLDMGLAPRLSASVLDLVTAVGQVGDTSHTVGVSGEGLFATALRQRTAARMMDLGNVIGQAMKRIGRASTASAPSNPILGVQGNMAAETFLTLRCEGDASAGADPHGGSYEIQHFISAPGRGYFLSGQVLTVNFYACVMNGVILDGGLNISDFQYATVTTNGLDEQIMAGTVSFNGLSLTRKGHAPLTFSTGINAPLRYRARYRNGQAVSTHMESGNLVMSRNGDTVNDIFNQVTLYMMLDELTGTRNLQVAGGVTSSVLNDNLILSTPRPMAWQTGGRYPASGILRMEAAPSILTLTALDASLVQLDLDRDGDGLVDASDTIPWSSVLP